MKLLYLPIETTARELDAKLLLAHRALSRGYAVIIGRKGYVKTVAEKLKIGIYFYKSHNPQGFPLIKNKNTQISNVALDAEGLVFYDDEYLIRARPDKLEHLKIIFTWGKYQKELLLQENPDLSDKVFSVGNPRFDILRPEYEVLFKSSYEKFQKTYGKYVLINTNFGCANFNRYYKTKYLDFVEKFGRIKSEEDYRFYSERSDYYKQLFKYYRDMIKELSKKFPDLNFILRPHPSEDLENWEKALKGLRNTKVIYKDNVVNWIYGALAVIHTGCTTGIESWALKKPVLRYNPDLEERFVPDLPNKFGYDCRSIAELSSKIEKVLNGDIGDTFKEQIEIIRPYIGSIDGRTSSERIMDVLENKINTQETKISPEQAAKLKNAGNAVRLRTRIKRNIFKALQITGIPKTRIGKKIIAPFISQTFQKFPGLGKKYIHLRLKQFDNIHSDNISKKVKIKRILADTYAITIK